LYLIRAILIVMSSLSKPAALIALGQRTEAKQVILNAVEQAEGHRSRTAEILKVRPSTLYRLIVELEMWSEIDAMIERHGWTQRAGRARGPLGGIVMMLAVVAMHLTACEADEAAPAEVLDAPSAAGTPAPAPVEEPAEPKQPVEQPVEAAAGAPAPAPVEQPAAAGTPAPEPMNVAGTVAPTPSSAGAGAPAPMPSAGAPAPQAGAGGAPAVVVDTTPTKCKIASGLVLACDAFSQRYFPSMQVRWSVGPMNYGCATEAPRCVVGAACFVVHTDAGTSEAGVCQ
jgi:hypothetical protein